MAAVEVREVRRAFGPVEAVAGASWQAHAGQITALLGPNGAGKSTTVKILCGLISDYEGSVTIKGMDLKQDTLRIKSIIGYVPELADLYDVLTPSEFLHFIGALYNMTPDVTNDRIEKFLTAFGLKSNIHQRMDTFSKGMKQKVLIASGLMHNPEIIILDEPLSGLDANSVIIIKDLIQRLAKEGKTIFYCSHMMDIVEKVSEKIVLIDNGAIVANGSFAELKVQLGESSLEQMFANLTAGHTLTGAADDIMDAMHTQSGPSHE